MPASLAQTPAGVRAPPWSAPPLPLSLARPLCSRSRHGKRRRETLPAQPSRSRIRRREPARRRGQRYRCLGASRGPIAWAAGVESIVWPYLLLSRRQELSRAAADLARLSAGRSHTRRGPRKAASGDLAGLNSSTMTPCCRTSTGCATSSAPASLPPRSLGVARAATGADLPHEQQGDDEALFHLRAATQHTYLMPAHTCPHRI